MHLRIVLACCVGTLTIGCVASVSESMSSAELSGATMGTRYSIKCWSQTPSATTQSLQTEVDELLERINEQMSTYLPDSELSQFNASPAGEWFAVSKPTAFVTSEALRFHQHTNGASDVTVGPLVKLWDFGPGRGPLNGEPTSPAADKLANTRSITGAKHLESRPDPPALRRSIDGLEVDLSSIAKGYAVDAIAELLIDRDFDNFMVEIGGEVRAGGTRQDGKPWRIGVESPNVELRAIHKVVSLMDMALATSGDYRNFRVIDGQKISHIIDPKSGSPLPYRGWSVTLLAKTCLEADALATALLVMGEDQGYDWCREYNVAAMFLIRDGEEIIEKMTPRFLENSAPMNADSER